MPTQSQTAVQVQLISTCKRAWSMISTSELTMTLVVVLSRFMRQIDALESVYSDYQDLD